ncbi:hypothetical protein AB0E62_29515 [Streptomyces sp. NPDC038707]|uniref:hypothetical protein n=1 Tax=Streptomyces sp. NPDC038707 TaxID=3154329 RepID=UPI0033FD017E
MRVASLPAGIRWIASAKPGAATMFRRISRCRAAGAAEDSGRKVTPGTRSTAARCSSVPTA